MSKRGDIKSRLAIIGIEAPLNSYSLLSLLPYGLADALVKLIVAFRNILFVIALLLAGDGRALVGISPAVSDPVHHRLDPALRRLMESPHLLPPSSVNIWRNEEGEPQVTALLAVRPDADLSFLPSLRARVNSAGSIVSVDLPVSALRTLAMWPSLHYAEAARKSRPLLNQSAPAVQAETARTTFNRSGKGVLIGLVDTGIDIRHPDFRTATGHTRIKYLWDQTDLSTGGAPTDQAFGREYTEEQINQALFGNTEFSQRDGDGEWGGHGTHVAGIAAGNGGGTPFVGMAPEASLIIVKWDGAHGLDANRYIMARAERLGLPVVINNSWGGQYGPHDGTDNEAKGLSELVGPEKPGRSITFSSGNKGGIPIHLSGSLSKGQTGEVSIVAPAGQTEFEIEVWADVTSEFRFGLTFPTDTSNRTRGSFTVDSGKNGTYTVPGDTMPYNEAIITIDARDRPYPLNPGIQRCSIYVDLRGTPAGTINGLSWALTMERLNEEGNPQVDGWIVQGERLRFASYGSSFTGDTLKTLVNQACMLNGIVVGAFITKNEWTAFDGSTVTEPLHGKELGDPAHFSAQGPTRDGREKPDLIAPGQWVASALSGDMNLPLSAKRYVTPDGRHVHWEGTSMASPHVSGAVALMFETQPALTAPRIIEALRYSSSSPSEWTPKSGYGKLNIHEALRLSPLTSTTLPGDLTGDGVLDLNDAIYSLQLIVRTAPPTPLEIRIGDVAPAAISSDSSVGDGKLTVEDTVRILRRIVDLEPDPWP